MEQIWYVLNRQRGHLFPWCPVFFGSGIGVYFLLGHEPSQGQVAAILLSAFCVFGLAWFGRGTFGPLALALALCLAGLGWAAVRAHLMAAPVLDFRFYGAITGRIVAIDRSASDALRLTLDQVALERVSAEKTPERVRVSLHGDQRFLDPQPGAVVILTGHLLPPSGPVEPGGFDFQRHVWFKQIGAVGYTRTPVLTYRPGDGALPVFRLRMAVSRAMQDRMAGDVGGFAAAVTSGDRSGLDQSTVEALRASNLAHLLAISGLHVGLLAGFVFAVVRIGVALVPYLALRLSSKKLAAAVSLVAAAGYLALSGGNVATQRAFIMAAVFLMAIIADRRALSLRAVALAALIVMVLRPEEILGPGFQMSFAATTALVAVFAGLRDVDWWAAPRWMRPALAVVVSSLVAGLATAPFAAAHFNAVSHYGLPANLLSVPVMGMIVVPSAVLALCLAPFGLEHVGLWAMGLGLEWILAVAHFVAGLENARGYVPMPPAAVVPLIALGALAFVLWQGRGRWIGMSPILGALILWAGAERPTVLIADTGALVGAMTPEGRVLSKPRGAGFVALNWLENDGDPVSQEAAYARRGQAGGFTIVLGDTKLRHVFGKSPVAGLAGCAPDTILVLSHEPTRDLPCTTLTPASLRQTGSVSMHLKRGEVKMTTARQISGLRLWNSAAVRGRQ